MPSTHCILGAAFAFALGISTGASSAEVSVGGAVMLPSRDIVENASSSKDHVILVQAVKAAGLGEALKAKGPMTVFAPVNSAFVALPEGALENLLKPESRTQLASVLSYHVVPGILTYGEIEKAISAARDGEAKLTTLAGGTLTAKKNGPRNIIVRDEMNNVANISTYDVLQSNGVIHVIDRVLLPK
jgi:uncharacterized surface protein with fasciclin (FAS1) repeats